MPRKRKILLWIIAALIVFALSFPLSAFFQTVWQELVGQPQETLMFY
ncbi:MAG: hypothetical protein HYW91_01025 [Candidatus Sungbacteria bacterium]|nr:hypothetical protein [Candidatus Sungbacteria bacterium]